MKDILDSLYTTRWYLSKLIEKVETSRSFNKDSNLVDEFKEQIQHLKNDIENYNQSSETSEVKLWYPKAHIPAFRQNTLGEYKNKYPLGLIVHYIVAPQEGELDKAVQWAKFGKDNNYTFFTIGTDGSVVQSFSLDRWGQHAGDSYWDGIGTDVSRSLVGVEIVCEGLIQYFEDVKKWGHESRKKQPDGSYKIVRRYVKTKSADMNTIRSNSQNICKGTYEKYTEKQEKALIELILWLKGNNPSVFNLDFVLGHDEVAGPSGLGKVNPNYQNKWRKVDPGGSLSMTMNSFRTLLKKKYNGED